MSFVKSHKGLLGLLIAVVALMAAACGGSDPAPAPAATAETRIVEVTTEVVREVVVTQEVELIREVQVTQEVQVEVEKIVEVVREVEVIKEVEVMEPSGPKETIIFSDLNWTSVQLQNRIAMFIVENGYGYPVDTVTGNTISGFVALENGDTHVSMEIWLPNQQVVWDKAIKDGAVLSVGKSLDDNWQSTFVVPTYVIEANPGLVKVSDLPDYMHLFVTPDSNGKARLLECIPGWECEITGANKVITYGLEDVVDPTSPGSAASLFADLYGAYQKGEPWLGYVWGPTQAAAELDLTVLEEPPYSDECWAGDQGCAYPTAEVLVAVHSSLAARAPDVVEFLRAWDFTAGAQVAAETWMGENNETVEAAALWYLQTQESIWSQYVPADVAAKVKAALPS